MKPTKWTDEELDLIRTHYLAKMPIAQIAQLVGRTENATAKQLTKMGIRNTYKPWTTAEVNRLHALFNADVSYADIASILKRTERAICSQIRDLGLHRNRAWTQEEINLIKSLKAQKIKAKIIAERLNRTYSSTVDAIKRFVKKDEN